MKYLFIIFSFVYAFSNEPSLEQTHEQNKPDENKTQTQAIQSINRIIGAKKIVIRGWNIVNLTLSVHIINDQFYIITQ